MRRKPSINELNKIIADAHKKNRKNSDLFSGRPLRAMIISNEDILNLRIALHSSKSIEEFILKV